MMLNTFRRSAFQAAVLAVVVGVAGCATPLNNQDWGRILGTGTGAILGSTIGGGSGNTLAKVLGGVAGYIVGGNIGRNMDMADQERSANLVNRSLTQSRPGTYSEDWRSHRGAPIQSRVTTQPYYQDQDRRKCRRFTQQIWVDGQAQTGLDPRTACFERHPEYPQGIWVIQ